MNIPFGTIVHCTKCGWAVAITAYDELAPGDMFENKCSYCGHKQCKVQSQLKTKPKISILDIMCNSILQ